MTIQTILLRELLTLQKKQQNLSFTSFMGEESVIMQDKFLNRNNIPTYATPEEAVESYMYLYHYARNLAQIFETPEERDS